MLPIRFNLTLQKGRFKYLFKYVVKSQVTELSFYQHYYNVNTGSTVKHFRLSSAKH